jgi:hypothetical protein
LKIELSIFPHLRLGPPSRFFPSGFHTRNPIFTSLAPDRCHTPHSSHPSWFYQPIIWWRVQIIKLPSLCIILHFPCEPPSILYTNILSNTRFSNTLSVCYRVGWPIDMVAMLQTGRLRNLGSFPGRCQTVIILHYFQKLLMSTQHPILLL